ncbi:altronate dehydratase family protein [Saccharibacillus sp. CPCC 101409]|uniref:UxaA family hydrolase n=1 Tax=Saccharibacillus sp. CPCC 101409 TaxID=3058041 RepID=UPI002671B704|nr:altronate dehydratase family protein [Saccharibacillus sp. CPCC 101409]MDO3411857.1 altronate dehydratase family protein [Saccharibacillus sp. CPCC 101409]
MKHLTKMNVRDNVAVALRPIGGGERLELEGAAVETLQDVPQGHKIALADIAEGGLVLKYGAPIGYATEDIPAGSWVHTHNVRTTLAGEERYEYAPELHPAVYPPRGLTFDGYRRASGKTGIRNDLYIVPTVGCVNGVAELMIADYKALHADDSPFDNVTVLKHPYGCSQLGDDHRMTRSILLDAVNHPNAGGVLVFGLGCENNIVAEFRELLGDYDTSRVKFLVAQEVGDEVEAGLELLEELHAAALGDRRQPVPLSELNVGLKCGGSDGFSGITANPLLGAFSDFLIGQGGSTVLTEVPEMFGAEKMLMARAENEQVFEQIVSLINDFKQYFLSHGEVVYENPSPGNKAGGITTLEDKSLGCTQKAGTSAVVDVLQYGEKLSKKGLSLLQAPGNDLVASSALAAADCQLVLFTTGRGTPFGSFVPTVKVATNNQLFEKKGHWMDFNAGPLLERPMEDVLESFIAYIIEVASGRRTRNEQNQVRELAIFKTGVTL